MLTNQFNTLIKQYQNTYQDFVNTIGSNDISFVSIPNSAYTGGNNINTTRHKTINECTALCSSNNFCTGATFDQQQNSCTLSSGNGTIISSSNQTAIVKQALYYIYQLQSINNQLTQTNNDIMNLANSTSEKYQQNLNETSQKTQILQQNYNILQEERKQIEQLIREYETLDSVQANGVIVLTSNYYLYIILLVIAFVLIFLLIKFSSLTEQSGGGNNTFSPFIFWIILAFIIIFNSVYKNY
jgi:DNA anti-recombination protein RmuC